jgi:predicted RNA methylase
MAIIEDMEDIEVVSKYLPTLISDVQAIVADAKTQDDAAEKIAELASGIAQLAATVATIAASMEANKA